MFVSTAGPISLVVISRTPLAAHPLTVINLFALARIKQVPIDRDATFDRLLQTLSAAAATAAAAADDSVRQTSAVVMT